MKKLKHELIHYKINDVIFSAKFLNCVNLLLIDDVAKWAETNLDVVRILAKKNSSQKSIDNFRTLFCERFFVKFIKSATVNFDIELNDLRQFSDEFINIYDKRLTALMLRVKIRNRTETELSLFLLEFVILNVIMKSFVRDLLNDDTRKKTIRDLIMIDKSLKDLCNLTKNVDRVKKKFHKLMKKENKTKELIFYKKMINKSTFQDKVQIMLIFYKIDAIFIDWIMKRSFDRSQSQRMSLKNFIENLRYQESNNNDDFNSLRLQSQLSNLNESNLEKFMSESSMNQKIQNLEITFSQNSEQRFSSAFNDRRSEFHRSCSKNLSSSLLRPRLEYGYATPSHRTASPWSSKLA